MTFPKLLLFQDFAYITEYWIDRFDRETEFSSDIPRYYLQLQKIDIIHTFKNSTLKVAFFQTHMAAILNF